MTDEQSIALLTEIRDLMKKNSDNYDLAIKGQHEWMELQRKAFARQKTVAILVFVVVALGFVAVFITTGVIH